MTTREQQAWDEVRRLQSLLGEFRLDNGRRIAAAREIVGQLSLVLDGASDQPREDEIRDLVLALGKALS